MNLRWWTLIGANRQRRKTMRIPIYTLPETPNQRWKRRMSTLAGWALVALLGAIFVTCAALILTGCGSDEDVTVPQRDGGRVTDGGVSADRDHVIDGASLDAQAPTDGSSPADRDFTTADAQVSIVWIGIYDLTWRDLGVTVLQPGFFCGTGPIGYSTIDVRSNSAVYNGSSGNRTVNAALTNVLKLASWNSGYTMVDECIASAIDGDTWRCAFDRKDLDPNNGTVRCIYRWEMTGWRR